MDSINVREINERPKNCLRTGIKKDTSELED
jgi:hypothetical protein